MTNVLISNIFFSLLEEKEFFTIKYILIFFFKFIYTYHCEKKTCNWFVALTTPNECILMRHKNRIINDMIWELYSTLDLLLLAEIEHENDRGKKRKEKQKKNTWIVMYRTEKNVCYYSWSNWFFRQRMSWKKSKGLDIHKQGITKNDR